jgi:hypothetical protein
LPIGRESSGTVVGKGGGEKAARGGMVGEDRAEDVLDIVGEEGAESWVLKGWVLYFLSSVSWLGKYPLLIVSRIPCIHSDVSM